MSAEITTVASAKKMRMNYKTGIVVVLILSLTMVYSVLALGLNGTHPEVNPGAGLIEPGKLSSNAALSAQGVLGPEAACNGGTAPAVEGHHPH